MTNSRGAALLWVLVMIVVSLVIAGGSLAVSRMAVTTSVSTLERADGLFYAEAAAELAVAHIRQNSDMRGRLVDGAALSLSGRLPGADVSMRYEADLSEFNTVGDHERSLLVRVWQETSAGVAPRPFVARATLRSDLSVAEWFVLDYQPGAWRVSATGLPRFASCEAVTQRVTDTWGSSVANTLRWSFEPRSTPPDEVRVSWFDFRRPRLESRVVREQVSQLAVTTPLVSSSAARPVRVAYRLEAVLEGRVVDACVVEVVTGGAFFEASPTRVCAENDTVQAAWDVNASSGVELRLSVRGGGNGSGRVTSVVSRDAVGSMPVPVPRVGGNMYLELVMPSNVGGARRVTLHGGC